MTRLPLATSGAFAVLSLALVSCGPPPRSAEVIPAAFSPAALPALMVPATVLPAPASAAACPQGMAALPAGGFRMGSNDGDADEKPIHKVNLAGFCMDQTEVTVAAYAACVRAGGCAPAAKTVNWEGISEEDRKLWSSFCNGNRSDRQNHPVNCVDWEHATVYCGAVGSDNWESTAPVGSFPGGKTAQGL